MASNRGQNWCATFWISCLLVVDVPGVVSNVALTSIPSTTQPICPGVTVEFTCITTGSSRLSWTSDEYIGVGNPLEFRSIDPIGSTLRGIDTIANLTDVNGDILTSTLQVVTKSTIPSSTITCISGGLGTTNISTVQVATVPRAPQNVMVAGSMEDCMIQVTWDPPADTDVSDYTYRVDIPSRNITASNISSTGSTLHVPNCDDDIPILVHAVNRFGCLTSTETRLRLQSGPTGQLGAGAIAGIAIASAIILCCPCAVIAGILLYCCCCFVCTSDKYSTTDIPTSESHELPEILNLKTEDVDSKSQKEAIATVQTEDVDSKSQKEAIATVQIEDVDSEEAIIQAKECYQQQSKHDIDKLGTEKNRVSVLIWIDSKLDRTWKDSLHEAVQSINEAAPGLSLLSKDKKQAIIHVLASDKKEAYTEGNILMRFTPGQADYVTKIHLGKWEDNRKKGISTRELFHALGFRQDNNLGLTRFDPLSIITPCQSEETHDPAAQKDPVWLLTNATKENTQLSELDKVNLNLVYRPCRDTRIRATNAGYAPKLGETGMYYCERPVMSGHTYPGDTNSDGVCGPNNGPNCPACRTIKNRKIDEILAGGKWQGMTGKVYCGKQFAEPGEIDKSHDGMCGMDNGPACPDCVELLNKEI